MISVFFFCCGGGADECLGAAFFFVFCGGGDVYVRLSREMIRPAVKRCCFASAVEAWVEGTFFCSVWLKPDQVSVGRSSVSSAVVFVHVTVERGTSQRLVTVGFATCMRSTTLSASVPGQYLLRMTRKVCFCVASQVGR